LTRSLFELAGTAKSEMDAINATASDLVAELIGKLPSVDRWDTALKNTLLWCIRVTTQSRSSTDLGRLLLTNIILLSEPLTT
jgi:hypothetical protein